ncbi:MAG: hypothetical protein HUK22_03620, partial [Thermoguttaceae bacterium]|nr:hypothetical protein [Thermoguttaceae bacterium]
DADFYVGAGGALRATSENGGAWALKSLDASTQGGSIVIGENNVLAVSGAPTTNIGANISGKGALNLANVATEKGVTPWSLAGNNGAFEGTIRATDADAAITLDSETATGAKSTVELAKGGTLDVNKSNTLGTFAFNGDSTIDVAAGKTLAVKGLTASGGALKITGGGSVALAKDAASNYGAKTTIDGATLNVVGDNRYAEGSQTTLTNGGKLQLDYAAVDKDTAYESLWGRDLVVSGDGTLSVVNAQRYDAASGLRIPVNIDESIEFDAEKIANALTFNVENADVRYLGDVSGQGALIKTGNGILDLQGRGAFASANVKSGVLTANATQLATADVALNGGGLVGNYDAFKSLTVGSGSYARVGGGTVALTGEGNALVLNGGDLYVDVKSKEQYTNYAAGAGDVKLNSGSFRVEVQYGAN